MDNIQQIDFKKNLEPYIIHILFVVTETHFVTTKRYIINFFF